jgi:hypothetical protein
MEVGEGPVKVGGFEVRIVSNMLEDVLLAEEGSEGTSDLQQGLIRVRSDLPEERWREVVMHELLHHVWHLTNLPVLMEEQEEHVIRAIAPWLSQVCTLRFARA